MDIQDGRWELGNQAGGMAEGRWAGVKWQTARGWKGGMMRATSFVWLILVVIGGGIGCARTDAPATTGEPRAGATQVRPVAVGVTIPETGKNPSAATAPATTVSPATHSAASRTIKNAPVQFNGTTYYLTEHDPGLPADLMPALTVDSEGNISQPILLWARQRKIAQAIEIRSTCSGLILMDLDRDGKDEVILVRDRYRFAELFPRAKVFSISDAVEYGKHSFQVRATGGNGEVLRVTSTGELESIVDSSFNLGGHSSYGYHRCTFADLYGDGRPIPCRVVEWVAEPPYPVTHASKAELESYWHPDKPGGKWVDEPIHLAIPDGPDVDAALRGILNPATFKPTAIMIERDRIRAILPAGWVANITDAEELSFHAGTPVSYCRAADLAEHGRDYVARNSLQTNIVEICVHLYPHDGPAAGSVILTPDHRIVVWNGIMPQGDVFFDEKVAKQYTEVEAAVRRVVAVPLPGGAATQAATQGTTRPR